VAFVASACATLLDSGWRLTLISLLGLPVNIVLNLVLIPLGLRVLGPNGGGGGAGAALAALGTELFVVAAMIWTIGRNAIDRRVVITTAKLLGVSAAVTGIDLLLSSVNPVRRLVLDALAFVGLALAVRAVDLQAIVRFIRAAVTERRAEAH
jgi:O-antigen/teichoic acid export membrane protein